MNGPPSVGFKRVETPFLAGSAARRHAVVTVFG